MIRSAAGEHFLFYGAGWWESPTAGVGYARCAGPMGPCTDAPENPILSSYNTPEAGCLSGPGHQALFESAGRQYVVFHAHAALPRCRDADKGRYMYISPLSWEGGQPRIGPSLRPASVSARDAAPPRRARRR